MWCGFKRETQLRAREVDGWRWEMPILCIFFENGFFFVYNIWKMYGMCIFDYDQKT